MDLLGGVSEVGVTGGVTNDGEPGFSGVDLKTGSGFGRCGVCGAGWTNGSGFMATGGDWIVTDGVGSTTGSGKCSFPGRGPGCTGVDGVNWRKNCLFCR